MSNCKLSKAQLRDQLRRRRQQLSPGEQLAAAAAVAANIQLLPCWPDARRIALYIARDGEVDTSPLSEVCRAQAMELFLPVIDTNSSLNFAQWKDSSQLHANRYGIPEPPVGAQLYPPTELDIVILPLVGWDRHGGRLGMGGGFYDRTLAGISATALVGVAHALQELGQVPLEEWDIPLDFVVTDIAVHDCRTAH